MNNIAQHIEYLLMHHDCVVVPGFGAFMLNRESARYDSESGLFMPPSCSLGFNPEVRHNDALLVGSISRRDGVSLDAARNALDASIASFRHQLHAGGEASVGNLGRMVLDEASESMIFDPADDSLPLRMYGGLRPLNVSPFESESETPIAGSGDDSAKQTVVIPFPLKVVASVLAVIIGLGILYSTTSLVNNPKANFASLDTGISTQLGRVIDSTVAVSREILLNIAVPPTSSVTETEPVTRHGSEAQSAMTGRDSRYLLVVGSFPTSKSAQRYVDESSDGSMQVIEMDGNFRVYVASASTVDDARSLAADLADRYPNVWVCRK
ncbi:MAG: hypothetical protein NC411_08885 [Bacteroides sp.]|nr:hypothetical protein [Bacteroides sp.]